MDITVRVHFKQDMHKKYPRCRKFMNELEKDFEEIAKKYFDEFSFRYNARKASVNDKFDYSLENSTRLMYKQLIGKA